MKADKTKSHLKRTYLLLKEKKNIGYFKKIFTIMGNEAEIKGKKSTFYIFFPADFSFHSTYLITSYKMFFLSIIT